MIVKKIELPENYILKKEGKNYDYIDNYQSDFTTTNNNMSATEIGKAFFTSGPKLVDVIYNKKYNRWIIRIKDFGKHKRWTEIT